MAVEKSSAIMILDPLPASFVLFLIFLETCRISSLSSMFWKCTVMSHCGTIFIYYTPNRTFRKLYWFCNNSSYFKNLFWNIYRCTEVTKRDNEVPPYSSLFPSMITSYIVTHYPNWEINMGATCVYISVACYHIASCGHHNNQDTEPFHHHKHPH